MLCLPGTDMALNSASTLVFVDGRISPNWALLAINPTMTMLVESVKEAVALEQMRSLYYESLEMSVHLKERSFTCQLYNC
jgi:hypothetical protein